jgi:O-antigen ligase
VIIGFILLTVFGSTTYWNMMRTMLHPQQDYNMTADAGRKAIWKRGVGYMLSHPVVGVGAAAFEQAEGTLSAISREYATQGRGLKWSTAHNSFVLVGAELGIGGLVLFVTMLGTSFKHLARIKYGRGEDPIVSAEDAAFAQTLTASLIGFCVAGCFVSASYFSLLYVLIGLVVAEDSLRSRRLVRGSAGPSTPAPVRGHAAPRDAQRAPQSRWAPAG